MDIASFQAVTAEYLCFFEDGHTHIRWNEDEYLELKQIYLDENTYCIENGAVCDRYVVDIGGLAIKDIYKTMVISLL